LKIVASKCDQLVLFIILITSSRGNAGLYGLREHSASNASTIATILAERGISSPFNQSGYHSPLTFS